MRYPVLLVLTWGTGTGPARHVQARRRLRLESGPQTPDKPTHNPRPREHNLSPIVPAMYIVWGPTQVLCDAPTISGVSWPQKSHQEVQSCVRYI
eukprot:1317233-Rhodomonas_salina.2